MNEIIDQIYETRQVLDAADRPRDAFPSSIPYADGEALHRVVRTYRCAVTLEIGMAFGTSTLFICQAHRENGCGRHIVIDPHQQDWWDNIGRLNVRRAGFDELVTFYDRPSYEVLPQLLVERVVPDFAFIDGNHRFEHMFLDAFYVDRLLPAGGFMMLHDSWLPSTRKLLTFLLRNHSEHYALVSSFMNPPTSFLGGCAYLLRHWRGTLSEPRVALMFARKRFHNHVLLRKENHLDDNRYDETWDYYVPF